MEKYALYIITILACLIAFFCYQLYLTEKDNRKYWHQEYLSSKEFVEALMKKLKI